MYAVFENGSHQYRVSEGDLVTVDRHPGEHGAELVFDKVLLIAGADGATIGTPLRRPGPGSSAGSSGSSATRRSSSRSSVAAKTCAASGAIAST